MQKEDEELFNDEESDEDDGDEDGGHDENDSLADELEALELQDALEAGLSGVNTPAELDGSDAEDVSAEEEVNEDKVEEEEEQKEGVINASPQLAEDESGSVAQEVPTIPNPLEEEGSEDESKDPSEAGGAKGKRAEPQMSKKDKRRAKEKRKKEEQEAGAGGGTSQVSHAVVDCAHRVESLNQGTILACLQCL